MSIYDKASLVLIPSGTKTSKIFSQKPVNGDGDFTFSRSTAATRVNADGNIEKETQNFLLQSNSFSTSPWVTTNTSVTSGQSGYDGTNNAWLLDVTNGTNSQRLEQDITASNVVTLSIYAKAGTLNWIRLRFTSATSPNAYFDLENGVIGSHSGIDAQIESVGNGWYKCSLVTNDITRVRLYPADANGDVTHTSGNIYIQDAQLEQGLVARDYIETTTAAVEGGITDNVPRLDYTDSSCPALLLEPQRTNLSLQSEYLDTSPSVKDASTIEVNGITSPSGLDDACLFTETTANDRHGFYQYITIAAGALTASIFTKEIDRRYIHFQSDATGSGQSSYVDLQDGSVVSEGTGWTLSIEDYGNDWYRIKATCTAVAGNKYFIWGVSQNGTTNSYAGSTSSDFTFYGLQIEAGSYATSYIPTYGTSVTRNGDYMTLTSLDTNSIITDNDSWSAFFEVELLGNDSPNDKIQLSDNSNTPRGYLYANFAGVAGTGWSGSEALTMNTNNKIMYRANSSTNISFFENGVNEETFTSTGDALTFNRVNFYGSNGAFRIKRAILFPTALTDQEAIDLTTI